MCSPSSMADIIKKLRIIFNAWKEKNSVKKPFAFGVQKMRDYKYI